MGQPTKQELATILVADMMEPDRQDPGDERERTIPPLEACQWNRFGRDP